MRIILAIVVVLPATQLPPAAHTPMIRLGSAATPTPFLRPDFATPTPIVSLGRFGARALLLHPVADRFSLMDPWDLRMAQCGERRHAKVAIAILLGDTLRPGICTGKELPHPGSSKIGADTADLDSR